MLLNVPLYYFFCSFYLTIQWSHTKATQHLRLFWIVGLAPFLFWYIIHQERTLQWPPWEPQMSPVKLIPVLCSTIFFFPFHLYYFLRMCKKLHPVLQALPWQRTVDQNGKQLFTCLCGWDDPCGKKDFSWNRYRDTQRDRNRVQAIFGWIQKTAADSWSCFNTGLCPSSVLLWRNSGGRDGRKYF